MAGLCGTRVVPIYHHRNRALVPAPQSRFKLQNPFPQFNLLTIHSHPPSIMSATAIASSAAPNTAVHQHADAAASMGCWSEFAKNVSGEWDGYGADFTVDGKPIELPENVVPDAYREWEVKVFDWQTQCPTLAQPDNLSAMYKLIKLLPTVGCEADAATRFSLAERKIGGMDNMVSAFAYHSSGCYTAVWPTEKVGSSRVLELEYCLIDPRDKESRVRVIQVVSVEENKLVLKSIGMFVEQWYGPFRNGEQLGGCAIRDSAFASTQALACSEISDVWQRSNSVANFQNLPKSNLQELVAEDSVEKSKRDEHCLVLLPKNVWSSMKEAEDGETWFEVGWLLEPGHAITSKCIFSRNTELKKIVLSSETADQDL